MRDRGNALDLIDVLAEVAARLDGQVALDRVLRTRGGGEGGE